MFRLASSDPGPALCFLPLDLNPSQFLSCPAADRLYKLTEWDVECTKGERHFRRIMELADMHRLSWM